MKKKLLVALSAFLLFVVHLSAQSVFADTTAGASSWLCPSGVSSITVECWGGGGGGGFAKYQYTAAGSGAGGAYVNYTMPVTPGKTYYLVVGAGGAGGTDSITPGGNGGASYFGSTNDTLPASAVVLAVGGAGGNSVDSTGAKGAADSATGGLAAISGNLPLAGFNTSLYGAAGGSGTLTGATAGGNGANGGVGGAASTNFSASKKGYNGFTPGGGGSGAIDKTVKAGEVGGNGAVGEVQLTYISASSVFKPASFTATSFSATQINLSATSNANNNNIVVIFSSSSLFTPPTDGVAPAAVGSQFAGGTVFYNGPASGLPNQTGLMPAMTFYYEAFCYDASNNYSPVVKATAQTLISNLINTDFTGATPNFFSGISQQVATVSQVFGSGVLKHAYVIDTGFAIGTDSDTTVAGLMAIDTSVAGTSYTLGYATSQHWYVDYLVAPVAGYSLNVTNISGSMQLSGAASTNNFGILYGIGTATTPPSTFYNATTTRSVDTGKGTPMSGTNVKFSSITAGITLNGVSNITDNQVLYVRVVLYRAYPSPTVQTMFHSGLTIGGLFTNNLPVTIASFKATKLGNAAVLNWETATETGTKGFSVQRSSNGTDWASIGFVNSKGNIASSNKYALTDNSPLSSVNYYRLAQQDLTGKQTYSSTVSVDFTKTLGFSFYPNPVKTSLTVAVQTLQSNNATICVVNTAGRTLKTIQLNSQSSNRNISIDMAGLANGSYYVVLKDGNSTKTSTIIVE
jgi:hypothetical protein